MSSLPRLNVGDLIKQYKSSLPDIKGAGASSLKSSILLQNQLEPMPASKLSSLAKIGLADRNPLMTRSLASVQVQDKQSASAATKPLGSAEEFINRINDADINKRIMTKQLETSIQMRKFNINPADRVDSLRGFSNLKGQLSDNRAAGSASKSNQAAEAEQSATTNKDLARVGRELKNIDPYDCWAGSKAEYLKNKRRFERPMVL